MTQTGDDEDDGGCALCGQVRDLTFHHLIPRTVHRKARFQREYTKAELRSTGLHVCEICHTGIHDLIPDHKELAREFNTLDKLLSHPAVAKHVQWSRKQR